MLIPTWAKCQAPRTRPRFLRQQSGVAYTWRVRWTPISKWRRRRFGAAPADSLVKKKINPFVRLWRYCGSTMIGRLKDLLNALAWDIRDGQFGAANIYLRVSSDNAQDMAVNNNVSMRITWEVFASAPAVQVLSTSAHTPGHSAFHVGPGSIWGAAKGGLYGVILGLDKYEEIADAKKTEKSKRITEEGRRQIATVA